PGGLASTVTVLPVSLATASAAAAPTTPASSTTPAASHRPAAPAKASVRIYLPDAFFVSRHPVTVPHRVLHVGGVVRPYVPGQLVTVRAFIGRHLIKSARLRLKRSRDGRYGHFSEAVSVPQVGNVVIRVGHHRNAQMLGFL